MPAFNPSIRTAGVLRDAPDARRQGRANSAMPNVIKLRHPRSLASVALYQHQPHRQTGVASLFVIGYSIAAYFAYTTAGLPLAAALAEQVRLEALSNATANGTANGTAPAGLDSAGATLPGVGAAIPATPKTLSPSPPSPKPEGFEWDDEAAEDGELAGLRAADAALDAANGTASNGTSTKKERPLPSEWLPSAAVCVGIFLLACSHALFYLMCRWSIDFRLRQLYAPATDVKPGVIVCFRPLPHKGKPMLVPLQRAPISTELCCEFQRQKYEVTLAAAEPPSSLTPAAVAEEELALLGEELAPGSSAADAGAAATIRLVPFPTRNTRAFYGASLGLPNAAAVRAREERYGANILSAPTPRFVDLYIEQLLSPLAIFQVQPSPSARHTPQASVPGWSLAGLGPSRPSPGPSPRPSPRLSPRLSPRPSPRLSPRLSPRPSPRPISQRSPPAFSVPLGRSSARCSGCSTPSPSASPSSSSSPSCC